MADEVNELGLVESDHDFSLLDMVDDESQEEIVAEAVETVAPVQKKKVELPRKRLPNTTSKQEVAELRAQVAKLERLAAGNSKRVQGQEEYLLEVQGKNIDKDINNRFNELLDDPFLNNPQLNGIIDISGMMGEAKKTFNHRATVEKRYSDPSEIMAEIVLKKIMPDYVRRLREENMANDLMGRKPEINLKNAKVYESNESGRDNFMDDVLKNM